MSACSQLCGDLCVCCSVVTCVCVLVSSRYTFRGPTFDGPVQVTAMDFLPSLQSAVTTMPHTGDLLVHALPAGVIYKVNPRTMDTRLLELPESFLGSQVSLSTARVRWMELVKRDSRSPLLMSTGPPSCPSILTYRKNSNELCFVDVVSHEATHLRLPESFIIDSAHLVSYSTALVQSSAGGLYLCGTDEAKVSDARHRLAAEAEAMLAARDPEDTGHAPLASIDTDAFLQRVEVAPLVDAATGDDTVAPEDAVGHAWLEEMSSIRVQAVVHSHGNRGAIVVGTPWETVERGSWDDTTGERHPMWCHFVDDLTSPSTVVHTPLRTSDATAAGTTAPSRDDGPVALLGQTQQLAATVQATAPGDSAEASGGMELRQCVEVVDLQSMSSRTIMAPLLEDLGKLMAAPTSTSKGSSTAKPMTVVGVGETAAGDAAVATSDGVVRLWQVDKQVAGDELEAWMKLFGVQQGEALSIVFEDDDDAGNAHTPYVA